MSVERIEAAITKLDELRAESTPGPWEAVGGYWATDGDRNGGTIPGVANEFESDASTWAPVRFNDADLIVTLHRTIDAQLAILRSARSHLNADGRFSVNEHYALYLADAILGES